MGFLDLAAFSFILTLCTHVQDSLFLQHNSPLQGSEQCHCTDSPRPFSNRQRFPGANWLSLYGNWSLRSTTSRHSPREKFLRTWRSPSSRLSFQPQLSIIISRICGRDTASQERDCRILIILAVQISHGSLGCACCLRWTFFKICSKILQDSEIFSSTRWARVQPCRQSSANPVRWDITRYELFSSGFRSETSTQFDRDSL